MASQQAAKASAQVEELAVVKIYVPCVSGWGDRSPTVSLRLVGCHAPLWERHAALLLHKPGYID
jgi:hypothetical protein